MFDLETEVAAWSDAVHADRCRNAASVAELSDHLHCEIERARAAGLSDEQAFAAAVEKLGAGPELGAEHAKNRSLLGTICAAARHERALPRGQGGLLIAHALIWAAVILATSLMLSKTDAAGAPRSLFVTLVLLPSCWWASEQVLRRALRHDASGQR